MEPLFLWNWEGKEEKGRERWERRERMGKEEERQRGRKEDKAEGSTDTGSAGRGKHGLTPGHRDKSAFGGEGGKGGKGERRSK